MADLIVAFEYIFLPPVTNKEAAESEMFSVFAKDFSHSNLEVSRPRTFAVWIAIVSQSIPSQGFTEVFASFNIVIRSY